MAERERLDRALGNLIAVAAAGGAEASTLVAEIKRREKRKAEIDRVLTRPAVDRDGLRRALEAKLTEWKPLDGVEGFVLGFLLREPRTPVAEQRGSIMPSLQYRESVDSPPYLPPAKGQAEAPF